MRELAGEFIDSWIVENVHNIPGIDVSAKSRAKELVQECRFEARTAGYDIDEDEFDPVILEDTFEEAIEGVTDPELGFRD